MAEQQGMHARRVLKWAVPVDDNHHPIGWGPVVLVDALTPGLVNVWTLEAGFPAPSRAARVYGTGQPIPDGNEHLGSAVAAGGVLVWHVFAAERSAS